jgi:hypothetical protein
LSEPGAALDTVLDALVARDAAALAGARYTENGVELPVGEGLWATVDGIGPYLHTFADPASGQAAAFATVTEGETRSIMALRTALADGAVSQIEAIVARPPLFGAGGFGDGAAQLDGSGDPAEAWLAEIPADERLPRDELCRVADAYFAGLEHNDGLGDYPFAEHCVRIENGFRTTGVMPSGGRRDTPYLRDFRALSAREQFETGFFRFVTRIRDRRFPVIDETRGLVFAFGCFDHDGTVRDYVMADGTARKGIDRPFTWMIAEAFRIEHGLLTRIEALMTEVPYGLRPGW